MSTNPEDNPPSGEDKPRKGPKLFRPGEAAPDASKSADNTPAKPRLFRPGEPAPSAPTSSPSPAPPMAPTSSPIPPSNPAPSRPKLFKPMEEPKSPVAASPALSSVAPPMKPESPSMAKPVVPTITTPTPAPVSPPMKPKLFVSQPAPPTAPEPTPSPTPEPSIESQEIPEEVPKASPKDEKKKVSKGALASLVSGPETTPEPQTTPKKGGKGDFGAPSLKPRHEPKPETPKKIIRENLTAEVDVREMWYKAITAAFVASIFMVIVGYLLYCFTDDTILSRTGIFTAYSNGNVFNEVIGLWTVTYTPVTALEGIVPDWSDDWYLHLMPTLFAAVLMGGIVKKTKYVILSAGFYIFFGMLLPFIFLTIFPVFDLLDPSSVDGSLLSAYPTVIESLWMVPRWIADTTHCVFLGWCFGGAIELGLFAMVFAIVLGWVFGILSRLFTRNK